LASARRIVRGSQPARRARSTCEVRANPFGFVSRQSKSQVACSARPGRQRYVGEGIDALKAFTRRLLPLRLFVFAGGGRGRIGFHSAAVLRLLAGCAARSCVLAFLGVGRRRSSPQVRQSPSITCPYRPRRLVRCRIESLPFAVESEGDVAGSPCLLFKCRRVTVASGPSSPCQAVRMKASSAPNSSSELSRKLARDSPSE